MRAPLPLRVLQISALDVVSKQEIRHRLGQVALLAPELRAAYGVQLRDPQLSGRQQLSWGYELRERTRAMGALLVVNDRLDLALLLEADVVHLGRRSLDALEARRLLGERCWLTRSLHDVGDIGAHASRSDAGPSTAPVIDGWLCSPVFASPGKPPGRGLSALSSARRALAGSGAKLLALGGVTSANAADCLMAGADGVAAIRADLSVTLAS